MARVTVLRRQPMSTHRSARRGFRSAKRRSRVWDARCLMSVGAIYKGRGACTPSKTAAPGPPARGRNESTLLAGARPRRVHKVRRSMCHAVPGSAAGRRPWLPLRGAGARQGPVYQARVSGARIRPAYQAIRARVSGPVHQRQSSTVGLSTAGLPLPPGFDDGLGRCLRPWVAGTAHRQSTLV